MIIHFIFRTKFDYFCKILQILREVCRIYALSFTKCHVSTSSPRPLKLFNPPTQLKGQGKLGEGCKLGGGGINWGDGEETRGGGVK